MQDSIRDKFIAAFQKDQHRIKNWLVSWDYQKQLKNRKYSYDNLLNDFFTYSGKEDLPRWMNWFNKDYPDFIHAPELQALSEKSLAIDAKIFEHLALKFSSENYLQRIGVNNAHDYFIPNSYPKPSRYAIKNVLDFGAGYGRQANLWAASRNEGLYIAMDAIESSYCLQNLYFSASGVPLNDYIDNPSEFKLNSQDTGIAHVPTWRFDLIPDQSIDLVMCVQVLPELNSKLLRYAIDNFKRILKPGAMLYIRDNGYTWKPAGQLDVESYLKKNGFELEFKAHVIDNKDIHGIPRIWRNHDSVLSESRKMDWKSKLKLRYNHLDALMGGRIKRLSSKLK